MKHQHEHDAWLDQELRRHLADDAVDYASVEVVLARRIRESNDLGALSLLRAEEIPAGHSLEQVEQELFNQITQYSEYDEPVDECLRLEGDLPESQWKRLSTKLGERLSSVVGLALWEQQVMAPCDEPTVGHWEAIESVLFNRIVASDEQLKESWVRYETTEEPVTASSLDIAEELLDDHIRQAAAKPYWEQILSAEQILPFAHWERMEERLFGEFDKRDNLEVRKQPFWYILEHYSSLLRGIGVTGALVALTVTGIAFLSHNKEMNPTVVYQLEGSAADAFNITEGQKNRYAMVDGGGATLVNAHGIITLKNRAELDIEKCSKNRVHYRVGISSEAGKVAFLVHPRNVRQKFAVSTSDYRIEVKGTYFSVEADKTGKPVTSVLEGSVRITNGPFGDTVLIAGQCIKFNPSISRYEIVDGGQVVRRDDLERLPEFDVLQRYNVLSVRTTTPDAQVFIDGKFSGTAPVTLRQSGGNHHCYIRKDGFEPVDTMLFLTDVSSEQVVTIALKEMRKERELPVRIARGRTDLRKRQRSNKQKKAVTGIVKATTLSQIYADAQREERSDNWRKAIKLYQQVFNDPNASALRREDALFSVGKLQAEHERNTEVAKETFLTYLAMFPSGTFAGESWLRLAELEFRKNPDGAVQYYLHYFKLFPRHPRNVELQDRVGMIYMQQKHFSKAIDMFEQAMAASSTSGEEKQQYIAAHLHQALVASGNSQRAETIRLRYLSSIK